MEILLGDLQRHRFGQNLKENKINKTNSIEKIDAYFSGFHLRGNDGDADGGDAGNAHVPDAFPERLGFLQASGVLFRLRLYFLEVNRPRVGSRAAKLPSIPEKPQSYSC